MLEKRIEISFPELERGQSLVTKVLALCAEGLRLHCNMRMARWSKVAERRLLIPGVRCSGSVGSTPASDISGVEQGHSSIGQ